jgi:hypothetical protein
MPTLTRSLPVLLLGLASLPSVLTSQVPPRDAAPAPEKGTAVIAGQVIVAGEGTPVPRVTVMVMRFDRAAGGPPPRHGATTDDRGRFEVRDLPAGRYSVMPVLLFQRPQFVLDDAERTPTIELTDGERKEHVVLRVRRTGVIVVRAVDEFGDPIVGADVTALRAMPGRTDPQPAAGMRQTDDLGRVRLYGLAPGDYYVRVEQQRVGGFMDDLDRSVGYLPTFNPGVLALEEAAVLQVGPGQEIGEVEIQVRSGRTFRVSGMVVSAEGAPAPHASVFQRRGSGGQSATVRPDGTFAASGLIRGEYTFQASTVMRPGSSSEDAEMSDPVTIVVDRDIEGLTLSMRRAARVAGRLVIERHGESQIDPAAVQVRAMPPAPGTMMLGPASMSQARSDGTFTLSRLFGRVLIRMEARSPWRLKAVRYKGADITDEATEFSDSPDPRHLEVVVTDRGARLTAHVTNAKGSPAGEGWVWLFAADEKWRFPASTMTHGSVVGQGGIATLDGLRSGTYLAVALESVGSLPYGGEEGFFEKLVPLATQVELIEHDAREIGLTLVSPPR